MKKRIKILGTSFLIFIIILSTIYAIEVTGDVTGKVSAQTTNVSVTVTVPVPILYIINPKNRTYLNKQSIPLTYTVSGEESVWYSLDAKTNITLKHPTHFSVSEGSHTIYLYANNTYGITTKNVTFSVNSTKFHVTNSKYTGPKKGESTVLSDYSYEELQNLSNLTLENTDFGKIKFNDIINLINDNNPGDNEIDIDSFMNISSNRIEINSTALPNLNKSATLWLSNLSFLNPRVLRDGSVCLSTICIIEDYSSGTLKFNVTAFSVYSTEETPTEELISQSGGRSRSGAGETIISTKSFEIVPEQIKVSATQGSVVTKKITITNKLDKKINIDLSTENLDDFLITKEKKIELLPKESKEISFDIIIRENVAPNLYIGKLVIKEEESIEKLLILIEIESREALFDLEIKIPEKFLKIPAGENIIAEVKLSNIGIVKETDFIMEYIIKDKEGNKISFFNETITVETPASFTKKVKIPNNTKEGKYFLYTRAVYNNKTASSSAEFSVIKSFPKKIYLILCLIFILSIILILILIFKYYKTKQKRYKKIKKRKINLTEATKFNKNLRNQIFSPLNKPFQIEFSKKTN